MKKISLFISAFLLMLTFSVRAQTIESVVSNHGAPIPSFGSGANAGDAVDIIMYYLNSYASLKCSNTLGDSLKPKIAELGKKYAGVIPPGKSADFLVLTDKFACKVVAVVQKTQEINILNNACSVDDIKLVQPNLVYNPDTTGFFTITVKF